MKTWPVTGPIPPEKFAELVAAPFGKATEVIREYDPLWGRAPGEKIKWEVRVTREYEEEGVAYVMAATEEEASDLADKLKESDVCWVGPDFWDFEISSVKPAREPRR